MSARKAQSRAVVSRCGWATDVPPLYQRYHDEVWGVPVYDGRKLFEMLTLEGVQAGLSWYTILCKQPRYREVFDGFEPRKMAAYNEKKIAQLLADPGIVRNRLKVGAAIANAQALLRIQGEEEGFSDLLWSFVGGVPLINHWSGDHKVPASTAVSEAMSRSLKRLGFKFVGPTICYAFMQAVGMVNDHTTHCFRHQQLCQSAKPSA